MTTTHFVADAGQHPTSPPGPTDGVTGPTVHRRAMAALIRDHAPGDCWHPEECATESAASARWPEPYPIHDIGGDT